MSNSIKLGLVIVMVAMLGVPSESFAGRLGFLKWCKKRRADCCCPCTTERSPQEGHGPGESQGRQPLMQPEEVVYTVEGVKCYTHPQSPPFELSYTISSEDVGGDPTCDELLAEAWNNISPPPGSTETSKGCRSETGCPSTFSCDDCTLAAPSPAPPEPPSTDSPVPAPAKSAEEGPPPIPVPVDGDHKFVVYEAIASGYCVTRGEKPHWVSGPKVRTTDRSWAIRLACESMRETAKVKCHGKVTKTRVKVHSVETTEPLLP